MDILYGIFISILYLHLVNQYKTGKDLEVYEFEYTDAKTLHESCDILQPLIFQWCTTYSPLKTMQDSKIRLQVKDAHDFYKKETSDSFSMTSSNVFRLFRNSETNPSTSHYLSENNGLFLEDSGILRKPCYVEMDRIFKPFSCFQSKYDVLTGMKNITTPLRYHTFTRKYLYVTNGRIRVKMTPWKYTKYLKPIHQYYPTIDFRSSIDIWEKEPNLDDCVQFLEFDILKGHVFYIPKHWWYSISYNEIDTVILDFAYRSTINQFAYIFDEFKYFVFYQHHAFNGDTRKERNLTRFKNNDIIPNADKLIDVCTDIDVCTNTDVCTDTDVDVRIDDIDVCTDVDVRTDVLTASMPIKQEFSLDNVNE